MRVEKVSERGMSERGVSLCESERERGMRVERH